MDQLKRSSGVLLHITSLPGGYGLGDLGPIAYRWIDALAKQGVRSWQILPVHPPEAGHSPYSSLSAFAGNPLLISPEMLLKDGWISRSQLPSALPASATADFKSCIETKSVLIDLALGTFLSRGKGRGAFDTFTTENADWLDDFSLFIVLRGVHGTTWQKWPRAIARRERRALNEARCELADEILKVKFEQFLFFQQILPLKKYANDQGIEVIGDLPIFVSPQSADVWSHVNLFQMKRDLTPVAVAGVPPDMFSKDGQLWGNPLYDWKAMARTGFDWWVRRMRMELRLGDVVRLDHFRGFEAYWRVPAGAATARGGKWTLAPGEQLLRKLRAEFSSMPFIAEDLGVITPPVEQLRDDFELPGMRVLQFGFGGEADNIHLPHNYVKRSVAYTGTHDNDTTASWYAHLPAKGKKIVANYFPEIDSPESACWSLIRGAMASVADRVIVPLQDLLCLGSDARMNVPGRAKGNWGWRLQSLQSCEKQLQRFGEMSKIYGRSGE